MASNVVGRCTRILAFACTSLIVCGWILSGIGSCSDDIDKFVIVSDLQDWGDMRAIKKVTEEVIALKPPFVMQLGDACEPGVLESFNRIREAGIEIHIAIGNHDEMWRTLLLQTLPPHPLNSIVDPTLRFGIDRKFYYSFNRGGIHFVVLDTCTDNVEAEVAWMEDDLGRHLNNPDRLPSLVFMHYPEWMVGGRGGHGSIVPNQPASARPLWGVLDRFPKHTVKAGFGGHWHYGQNFDPKDHAGVQMYAVPGSALYTTYAEYLIVHVQPEQLVIEKRVVTDTDEGRIEVTYHPIPGRFTSLDQ